VQLTIFHTYHSCLQLRSQSKINKTGISKIINIYSQAIAEKRHYFRYHLRGLIAGFVRLCIFRRQVSSSLSTIQAKVTTPYRVSATLHFSSFFTVGILLCYLKKSQLKNNRGVYLSAQKSLLYLHRSSSVDVYFKTPAGSIYNAEFCELQFLVPFC
jgi:hypothetical protein